MNWHPIIFSDPMVRAILDGKKFQTRRVIKKQPINGTSIKCPYGKPGDFLWVKSRYALSLFDPETPLEDQDIKNPDIWDPPVYSALNNGGEWFEEKVEDGKLISNPISPPWRNALFMPRWVSPVSLKIEDVKSEMLHDISVLDIIDEGIFLPPQFFESYDGELVENSDWWDSEKKEMKDPVSFFAEEWDNINAKRGFSWKENPHVWRIKFSVYEIRC